MSNEQKPHGHHGHHDAPIQIPDATSLKLPWWTAAAAMVTGRAGGFRPVLNRVSLGVAERSARIMYAGRRMGLRFWAKRGRWNTPTGK